MTWNEGEPPLWQALLPPTTRAGSRTVICDPEGLELVIELARHGYRMFIVHDGSFDIEGLRRVLRQQGLSSQLMGSHVSKDGQFTSLVLDFYELWIFGSSPRNLNQAAESLKSGAPILWRSHFSGAPNDDVGEPLQKLPAGLAGVRRA